MTSKYLRRVAGTMIWLLFTTGLLCVSPSQVSMAADEYVSRSPLQHRTPDKRQTRRATRKKEQKRREEGKRKESLKHTSRPDEEISPASAKITDAKLKGQKYFPAEMERKRKEAKLTAEGPVESERVPTGRASRARKLWIEREKRDSFYELGL